MKTGKAGPRRRGVACGDGRPSGMLRGQSRRDRPAAVAGGPVRAGGGDDQPSATFNPEGTGGIINLVTNKGRGAGHTGSVKVNLGTDRMHGVTDTPSLRGRSGGRFNARNAFVGLTYGFGGPNRRRPENNFDFDNGGGGPGPRACRH